MNIVEKVAELDAQFLLEEDHSVEDLNFLFDTLFHPNLQAAVNSAIILGRLDKPIILILMENFSRYSKDIQLTLIPLFACTDFYESYEFLIKFLGTTQEEDLVFMTLHCLKSTHYFYFPLLLLHLSDTQEPLHQRLRQLVSKLGFTTLKPILAAFPELPQEQVFRDIFGNKAIDSLGLNRIP